MASLAQEELHSPEMAVEALEHARALTPGDPEVTKPLLDAYMAAERWAGARPLLDSLIEALRTRRKLKMLHVYLHMRGSVSLKMNERQAAVEDYEAAHELDATYVPNLLSLGACYFEDEGWDKALRIYQTLLLHQSEIDDDGEKADVFWHLGRVRQELGDPRRAKDMFSRALMLVPDHGPSKAGLEDLG